MDEAKAGQETSVNPKAILSKIETFTENVGETFKGLMGSLEQLQTDIKQLGQLKDVVMAAEEMLSGKQRAHVEMKAQGEVGRLVSAINKTLDNLQQLDKTVHNETGKVPELAQHLDQITLETENATQQVLEKLDQMIEASETQTNSLHLLQTKARDRLNFDLEARENIDNFLTRLGEGENQEAILQEAMDFVALMGEQARVHQEQSSEMNQAIDHASSQAEHLMNYAFDIMNLLQFQDITRQKISKVIALLKDMQSGLYRLLEIFNIQSVRKDALELTEQHKATQDKILERDALARDTHVDNVDDIIKNFQNQ